MDQKEIEAQMRSPLRCGGFIRQSTMAAVADKSTTDETYISGVMRALSERDQWSLHRKLEASNNPPRSLAPPGATTKL